MVVNGQPGHSLLGLSTLMAFGAPPDRDTEMTWLLSRLTITTAVCAGGPNQLGCEPAEGLWVMA